MNFLDPVWTNDGRLYAPVRFKEIIRELFEISKRINTSYNDLQKITPIERKYLLEFILEDNERQNRLIEESKHKK